MIVTYVYHSCCAIEFDTFSVIIDYYKDALDSNKTDGNGWVAEYLLKKEKPLYVLCTHSHADHFNQEVLSWDERKSDIIYIRMCCYTKSYIFFLIPTIHIMF